MTSSHVKTRLIQTAALLALGAFVAAVLLPYSSANAGSSLVHTPDAIGYNFGLLIVLLLCVAFSFRRRTMEYSVVLAFVALVWWTPGVVANIIGAVHGAPSLKSGADFAFVGAVALLVQVCVGVWSRTTEVKITRSGLVTSVVAGLIAITWGIGRTLPWIQLSFRAGTAGVTFNATGTSSYVTSCCSILNKSNSVSDTTTRVMEVVFILIAAIAISFIVKKGPGGIGLFGLAVAFSGEVVNGIHEIATSHPGLGTFYTGSALTKAVSERISVTVAGLPGLWINLAAEITLLLFGVYVLLASRIVELPSKASEGTD